VSTGRALDNSQKVETFVLQQMDEFLESFHLARGGGRRWYEMDNFYGMLILGASPKDIIIRVQSKSNTSNCPMVILVILPGALKNGTPTDE
jgi:hypothetical protein